MVKAVDLFAGFGGFTDGAKQAGVEVIEAHCPPVARTVTSQVVAQM